MAGSVEDRESTVGVSGWRMFSECEVRWMKGLKFVGNHHVEVHCGCTSSRYGDTPGTLRIYTDGHLEITCRCNPDCPLGNLTPAAFERHSRSESAPNWKRNIWVTVGEYKYPVSRTPLIKYYDNRALTNSRPARVCHRHEFLKCTQCNKIRRFRLRTREECRIYHDAFNNIANWKCSDIQTIRCEDDEERACRRVYRGCFRTMTCKGCTSCVCFGCETCRFSDCGCRTCIDFTTNADAASTSSNS